MSFILSEIKTTYKKFHLFIISLGVGKYKHFGIGHFVDASNRLQAILYNDLQGIPDCWLVESNV